MACRPKAGPMRAYGHLSYVRIPSNIFSHPAFAGRNGVEMIGLYVSLVAWSRYQKQDGFVPAVIAERILGGSRRKWRAMTDALVASEFFALAEGGFQIVDYEALADTGEAIATKKRRGAQRAKASRLRPSIIQRDGLHCHICHGEVPPEDVHIDHVHALANGGTSDPGNLKVAHSACNIRKGARWPG